MEWIENIIGIPSSEIIGILVAWGFLTVAMTIAFFWWMGKLQPFHGILAGCMLVVLAFGWYSGIIPSWISDYECHITPNAINYESREEYIQWRNECIKQMEKDEGKFAGAYCSGGDSGFADFNYYAKKESRRSK